MSAQRFVASVVLVLAASTFGHAASAKEEDSAMQVIDQWKGAFSAASKPEELVVRNQAEWKQAWSLIAGMQDPMPAIPKVDFEKNMVLAVFMGEKSSGGYSVTITSVSENGDVTAKLEKTVPQPGSMTSSVITSPYHAVCVPRSDKPVRFVVAQPSRQDAGQEKPADVPVIAFVAEMEPMQDMAPADNASQWTDAQKEKYASAVTSAGDAWKRLCPEMAKQVTPDKVRELSRWAKPQMEGYKTVPALDKAEFHPLGLDAKQENLLLEATLDTLPTHHALVTRWLKAYLRYNLADKKIEKVVITIRGERLE